MSTIRAGLKRAPVHPWTSIDNRHKMGYYASAMLANDLYPNPFIIPVSFSAIIKIPSPNLREIIAFAEAATPY